ncbi:hypothetical protein KL921_000797 [Ogataea angusta]|uniref:Central kinetochore subunit MCM21 n=1 Tax=Pichia angusta TaxID=870730 RepID=A0ABQ7S463_PICAN|nr:hypothetical protein KL921_000797 [Ogataea angusta]KAG7831835.1 hypothetical protein KL920_000170 [Ogataea angusta]KAG7843073.1 hypothetical protein KL942_000169 [Ogataea angusta]KAG7852775.1 hypothetical protein KL940_000476 [Ogataea angusta]KAG7854666.1 hypothetical protein KL939_004939 [Ogataea angusta]
MSTVDDLLARKEELEREIAELKQVERVLGDEIVGLDEEVEEDVTRIDEELAHHQYFDELIQNLMTEGIRQVEIDKRLRNDAKRQKRESATKRSNDEYDELRERLEPAIRLENAYRLGGLTAFPVNDPQAGESDRFLGIRFDIFDPYSFKYTSPHYVILRKDPKNDLWEVFKTTIPNYVPLGTLAYEHLNDDMIRFAGHVRRHLVQLQLKKAVFLRLQEKLESPSGLDHDLDFTKISVNFKDKLEIVLICDLYRVTKVMATYIDPEVSSVSKQVEILLSGLSFNDFDEKFLEVITSVV